MPTALSSRTTGRPSLGLGDVTSRGFVADRPLEATPSTRVVADRVLDVFFGRCGGGTEFSSGAAAGTASAAVPYSGAAAAALWRDWDRVTLVAILEVVVAVGSEFNVGGVSPSGLHFRRWGIKARWFKKMHET